MLDGADWMGDRSESSSSFEVPSPEVINLVSSEDEQPGKTVYRERMGTMDNHSQEFLIRAAAGRETGGSGRLAIGCRGARRGQTGQPGGQERAGEPGTRTMG